MRLSVTRITAVIAIMLMFGASPIANATEGEGEGGFFRKPLPGSLCLVKSTISGQFMGSDGAPLRFAPVFVGALPLELGLVSDLVPLSSGSTDGLGAFELTVCNFSSALQDEDGSVQLVFTGGTEQHVVYQEFVAYPPSASVTSPGSSLTRGPWRFTPAGESIATGAMSGLAVEHEGSVAQTANDTDDEFVVIQAFDGQDLAEASAAIYAGGSSLLGTTSSTATAGLAAAAPAACTGLVSVLRYTDTGVRRTVNVPIQRFRTLSNLKEDFDWSTTKKTKLGVGIAVGAKGYSAGMARSEVHNVETGLKVRVGYNSSFTTYAQWSYKAYKVDCLLGARAVPSSYRRWSPWKWTGESVNKPSSVSWTCKKANRVRISNETWALKEGAVEWSGSVDLKFVKVNSVQSTGKKTRLTLIPRSEAAAYACGDNDYPPYAHRVQEVL